VDINALFGWALALIVLVTLFWPLTIPLAALAYKVRLGSQPIPLETSSFWLRSTFASLGLAVLSGVALGLEVLLKGWFELPPVLVHLTLLALYVPVAVWFLFWMYALEDLLEALSLFGIYVLLPGLPLVIIGWLTGLWKVVAERALQQ
jgi:hypothetical protein